MKKLVFFTVLCAFAFTCNAYAVAPLSQYGQIQNVQNYSTNPFYQQGVYNPKAPQAIYATGADLNTGDCQRTVENMVASECSMRNNCRGLRLSDVRPAIVVKLSQLPGHNFATSCAGYIDSAFDNYMAKQGYNPVNTTAFPTPVTQNANTGFKMDNPYKQKLSAAEKGVQERTEELKQLQKQTQTTPHAVVGGDFPKTMADISFSDRIAVAKEGYEPFKDLKSYRDIKIESDEDFLERLKLININEYCLRVPNASECKVEEEKQEEEPQEEQTVAEEQEKKEDANSANDQNKNEEKKADDQDFIDAIVELLAPQNPKEEEFFTALATDFVKKMKKDENLWLDDKFVYDYLGTAHNLNKYREGLLGLTGLVEDEELGVSIDWDEVLINISTIMDGTDRTHTMKVCENNRSIQVGLEIVTDAIAVVVSIYTLGSGGAAIQAGKLALSQGLRALAKKGAKIALKRAGKKITDNAIRKTAEKRLANVLARKVLKSAGKENFRGLNKSMIKAAAKRAGKQALANLKTKRKYLLGAGAIVAAYQIGKHTSTAGGKFYSLVSSDLDGKFLNCHDLDPKEGCYAVCGEGEGGDDFLNRKVFVPILGKKYCVSWNDYNLYEMTSGGGQGSEILMFDDAKYSKIRSALKSLKDTCDSRKWGCDWNEDDIDAYIGYLIHDPDTLDVAKDEFYPEDAIRLDD